MKARLIATVLAGMASMLSLGAGDPCDAPGTTIIVVRHADRAGTADSLSAAGVERAKTLIHATERANVKAIYHSDTRRTRDTAAPLATALGIKPQEYPAKEVDALAKRILRDHAGQTVVVVGHSNTVPMIITAAGGPTVEDLSEAEYDRLFILHVEPCNKRPAPLVEIEFGAPSP
jgi:broad specificity phosphatase PhoE